MSKKKVTLVATSHVTHAGKQYGKGMQFDTTEDEAEVYLKAKQAELAPTKGEKAEAAAPTGKR